VTTGSRAVFLSYASEDAEAAQRICDALRAAGIEVWFDKSELRGGDAWDQSIRKQIRSCALFIPIISRNSHSRAEGYFRLEWKLAVDRSHLITATKAFLLPVVIDATPDDDDQVPDRFRELQWTRLPGGEAPPAFGERVVRLLSPEQAPVEPAPAHPRGTPPRGTLIGASHRSRGSRYALLAIGAVLVAAAGYFALKRFAPAQGAVPAHTSPVMAASPTVSSSAVPEKSIAVLPFVDLSEKHDQEYFADGMAEEVIDLLASIPGLKVIGRTSTFQFKGKEQDLRAIGSTLGVSHIVEGSVRRSGDRLRVTAQLISARDGSHVWSATYDEPAEDTLKVQDEIAANLARALQVSVGADINLTRSSFKSVEAYDLYLRGRHAYDRFDKEGLESAAAYFQQVLDLDPASVPAAEALAVAQTDLAESGFTEPHEGFERARRSVQHALALDPNSSLAEGNLGEVNLVYDWDWVAAERHAKEALRINPRNHFALGLLGMVYEALGRWDESARLFETALTVDPLFPAWHQQLANVRCAKGNLLGAEVEQRKALQISPTLGGGHFTLGTVLLAQGKLDAALSEMQQEQPDSGRYAGLAVVYHALGRRAESDAALARQVREHAQDNADGIADVYASRGELDQAFAWLDRAYSQKESGLYAVKGDPFFKNLRADPRYKAFLRKMNLPE
jgi:TolB-like protein/Tfp pilus assembly protein PilF